MKRALLIGCLITLISCDDGDLQIETLDFDSVDIDFCVDPIATSSNLLFKINDDEALILTLESGVLNNGEIGTDTIQDTSLIPSQSQITYRIFSESVTDDYFCDDFPPVSPTVIEEIEAEDGMVIINTVMNADSTLFTHTIQLSGISLVSSIGERITDQTINEFGEVTTEVPAN